MGDRGRWLVCENQGYAGRCVLLRRGNYVSLSAMGLENSISSVRRADSRARFDSEPQPMDTADYQYRRRYNERVYDAPVTSVRAVMGPPTERCWVERQQVSDTSGGRHIGGAIAGALIGGVLGHQVGGGSGKDLATAGGAVAGGAIGSNVGTAGMTGYGSSRDVRRCENTTGDTPAYWDVTYNFRGRDHQVQMSGPPGSTIAVNGNGEPRQSPRLAQTFQRPRGAAFHFHSRAVLHAQVVLAQHHRLARAFGEAPPHGRFQLGDVLAEGLHDVVAAAVGAKAVMQRLAAHAGRLQLAVDDHPEADTGGCLVEERLFGHGDVMVVLHAIPAIG